ncbi:hypothetical protein OC861_004946 [Tilletia horrida]|nr:hypothetical protein OC845_004848 [Tilletia horrida]KAK0563172.1 hypothetical protein OC861_004946 [Tilletia horrida]
MADIPYFALSNGVQMPSIQMGSWQGRFDGVASGLEVAIEVGYRNFDTAKVYGTETAVGEAIRRSGLPRKDFFVITKLANQDHHRVAEAFQDSYDKLGLEGPMDLFLIHWPHGVKDGKAYEGAPDGPSFNETWAEMEKLYEAGRVRAIGVSNFSIKSLDQLLTTAKIVPHVTQEEVHPWHPQEDLKAYCDAKKIHIQAYSPLGSSVKGSISPIFSDPDLQAIAKARDDDTTVGQIALSWLVQRGISAAPRSTARERMAQNLKLLQLSDEEMERIDGISKKDPQRHTRLANVAYDKEKGILAGGWTLEKLGWDVGFKTA